jgi:hypothetical protein
MLPRVGREARSLPEGWDASIPDAIWVDAMLSAIRRDAGALGSPRVVRTLRAWQLDARQTDDADRQLSALRGLRAVGRALLASVDTPVEPPSLPVEDSAVGGSARPLPGMDSETVALFEVEPPRPSRPPPPPPPVVDRVEAAESADGRRRPVLRAADVERALAEVSPARAPRGPRSSTPGDLGAAVPAISETPTRASADLLAATRAAPSPIETPRPKRARREDVRRRSAERAQAASAGTGRVEPEPRDEGRSTRSRSPGGPASTLEPVVRPPSVASLPPVPLEPAWTSRPPIQAPSVRARAVRPPTEERAPSAPSRAPTDAPVRAPSRVATPAPEPEHVEPDPQGSAIAHVALAELERPEMPTTAMPAPPPPPYREDPPAPPVEPSPAPSSAPSPAPPGSRAERLRTPPPPPEPSRIADPAPESVAAPPPAPAPPPSEPPKPAPAASQVRALHRAIAAFCQELVPLNAERRSRRFWAHWRDVSGNRGVRREVVEASLASAPDALSIAAALIAEVQGVDLEGVRRILSEPDDGADDGAPPPPATPAERARGPLVGASVRVEGLKE